MEWWMPTANPPEPSAAVLPRLAHTRRRTRTCALATGYKCSQCPKTSHRAPKSRVQPAFAPVLSQVLKVQRSRRAARRLACVAANLKKCALEAADSPGGPLAVENCRETATAGADVGPAVPMVQICRRRAATPSTLSTREHTLATQARCSSRARSRAPSRRTRRSRARTSRSAIRSRPARPWCGSSRTSSSTCPRASRARRRSSSACPGRSRRPETGSRSPATTRKKKS